MSDPAIHDLERLAELFKAGGWTELRVESDGLSLLFSTDPATASIGEGGATLSAPPMVEAPALATSAAPALHAKPAISPAKLIDPAWAPVVAPNLGTFYRSPKPGSAPFVEIGQRVAIDTEICLLEVMKLFTSVKAGVAGTVRRIDADDAELVEGGQVLFHIEPE